MDSQELDLFEGYKNDGFVEDPFHNKDCGIIANMDLLKGNRSNMVAAEGAKGDNKDKADMEDEDMADDEALKISSPEKITRKATNFAEIPPAPPAGQQEVIQNMLREWVETHSSDPLPPLLQNLACRDGVDVASDDPPHSTPGPTCRGQREKPISPGKVTAPSNELDGQRFVLTCTWPGLGGEGLTAGKDAVKAIIEKHGGKVTSGFSKITNFLVIGTTPGPKKVLDAHKQGIQIMELDQIRSIIVNNDMEVSDLTGPYPDAALAILSKNSIQVKRPPPPPDSSEHCAAGTSTNTIVVQSHSAGSGVGHSNG